MRAETEERIIGQLSSFAEHLKHVTTKEDLALVRVDLEKALRGQLKWLILLLTPTWVGLLGTLVGVIAVLVKIHR